MDWICDLSLTCTHLQPRKLQGCTLLDMMMFEVHFIVFTKKNVHFIM